MFVKIDSREWHYLGRWVDNVLDTVFWGHWAETRNVKRITKVRCNSNRISVDGHFYVWRETHSELVLESYRAAVKTNFSYFRNFSLVAKTVIKELVRVRSRLVKKKLLSVNDIQIFFREFQELFTPWYVVFPIAEGLERRFDELLSVMGLTHSEIQPYLGPSKNPETNKELLHVRQLVQYIASRKKLFIMKKPIDELERVIKSTMPHLDSMIKWHQKKYGWVGIHHFWGEPLSRNAIIETMKKEVQNYPFKSSQRITTTPPRVLRPYLRAINDLSFWRFRCAEMSGFTVFGLWNQLHRLAKSLGVEYDALYWFTRKEIEGAITTHKKLDKTVARQRQKMFAYVYFNGSERVFIGKDARSIRDKLFQKSARATSHTFSGMVASRGGIVKGRVHIVAKPSDVKQFQKGQVLVSSETTPDFVPAMKLAGAIITDIGGLTSHAAIVSRELGIPCIIGTKIATQVLKDGDRVEVNANTGVIKILH